MKTLIEKSRYLSLLAVITLLLSFGLALLWGVAKAVSAWREIISSYGQSPAISLLLIKLIDSFLIAIILYLLAASIYKLFIGGVNLPSHLVADNLSELKVKLSSVIVLVIAVRFVESLFGESVKPVDVLWLALATTLVIGALIAFGYFNRKNEKEEK
jgi:uncharacterized membrane protein YqhA